MQVVEAARGLWNVYVHLNVPYTAKSGRTLQLQIIQPSRDATFTPPADVFADRFPCVVFVQGSAWGEQALGASMAFWCRFAERGYTVAIVEYRPSSLAPFPAQVQDAKTAVRWLRAHADAYSVDADRIVMAGDSSGGHTALMVHATQDLDLFDDEPGQPLDITAFVDFYGPTDLARFNDEPTTMDHAGADSPEGRLLGGVAPAEAPERVRQANPSTWIEPHRPLAPLLMIHGSKDRLVPFAQSVYHYQALRAAGQPVELIQVRDGDHGLWPAIFNAHTADALDNFLQRHAGAAPQHYRDDGRGTQHSPTPPGDPGNRR
jgi:acetyl esterase/lipase